MDRRSTRVAGMRGRGRHARRLRQHGRTCLLRRHRGQNAVKARPAVELVLDVNLCRVRKVARPSQLRPLAPCGQTHGAEGTRRVHLPLLGGALQPRRPRCVPQRQRRRHLLQQFRLHPHHLAHKRLHPRRVRHPAQTAGGDVSRTPLVANPRNPYARPLRRHDPTRQPPMITNPRTSNLSGAPIKRTPRTPKGTHIGILA